MATDKLLGKNAHIILFLVNAHLEFKCYIIKYFRNFHVELVPNGKVILHLHQK